MYGRTGDVLVRKTTSQLRVSDEASRLCCTPDHRLLGIAAGADCKLLDHTGGSIFVQVLCNRAASDTTRQTMEAPEAGEAGPSSPPPASRPTFRKRTRVPKASGASTSKLHQLDPQNPRAEQSPDQEAANGVPAGVLSGDEEQEEGLSVNDLIALRSLQRKPTGIELGKLNKGLKKKKKKAQDAAPSSKEDRWREQMERGGLVNPSDMAGHSSAGTRPDNGEDEDEDSDRDDGAKSKARNRLARKDNFQGETNAIDVDKHMMAYIEEEMKKRKEGAGETAPSGGSTEIQAVLSNPEDELYKVAEKYARLQQEARNAAQANNLLAKRSRPDDEEGEGSVGLSSAMLSGIPEVELGMDSRLKNIEDTERAKRALYEKRRNAAKADEADDLLAGARFSRAKQQAQSDAQALASARASAAGQSGFEPTPPTDSKRRYNDRKEMASDDLVMQRFKKRQMNQMKR
ncbi:unnamed protein product [Parajaminaea phylloscopi]